MASSSIGMLELPYARLPVGLDGAGLAVHRVGRFGIISGVCSNDDVMRGEETKIVGCNGMIERSAVEQWLLLPGTHPKHIVVKGGQVTGLKTYMTGEIFDLLSKQSVLAASVCGVGKLEENKDAFARGLQAGISGDLLHELFMVRTNQLLYQQAPEQNHFYLSGVLIGSELAGLVDCAGVHLVTGPAHRALYALACELLHIPVMTIIDADEALIRGNGCC